VVLDGTALRRVYATHHAVVLACAPRITDTARIKVASILLAMAVPAFRNLTASTRLTTQANDFVSAINLARSESIKRNTTISFCRTAAAADTACAASTASWVNWIVVTAGGVVIRRDTVNAYNRSIVVSSTLTGDQLSFSSDGLARTGGALISEIDDIKVVVCATTATKDNIRETSIGVGSRLSTISKSGGC
jgi:type IV fimbrial biogenesis protein FimT